MSQFVIAYLGGDQPSSPDEGRKNFAKYQQWLKSLGDQVITPMVPFKNTHTIASDGSVSESSSSLMTGYTVVEAETIEQAVEFARNCPFLEIKGRLEVSELVQM